MINLNPAGYARLVVEEHVKYGTRPARPGEVPTYLARPAGTFVSIKKANDLRGCIGTIRPCYPSALEEIAANAVSAASHDPRFSPVRADELGALRYSVDVLGPEEAVRSLGDLDPRRYGVIVRYGDCCGVLLPDLEGVDTAEQQLLIAKRKAGIPDEAPASVFRFEVSRYTE